MEAKGWRVTFINEFRTSSICNSCLGQPLDDPSTEEAPECDGSEDGKRDWKLGCSSELAKKLIAGKGSFMELEETKTYYRASPGEARDHQTSCSRLRPMKKRVHVHRDILWTRHRQDASVASNGHTREYNVHFQGETWKCSTRVTRGGSGSGSTTLRCDDVYDLKLDDPDKGYIREVRLTHRKKQNLFGVKCCKECCSLAHSEQATTTSKRHRYVHRDVNAACNIRDIYLYIAKYGCRPQLFSHGGPRVGGATTADDEHGGVVRGGSSSSSSSSPNNNNNNNDIAPTRD